MEIALPLTIVTCVACIAAGPLVSALRPLAVAAGAVGLLVVCSLVWWALPSVALVFASMRRGGAA